MPEKKPAIADRRTTNGGIFAALGVALYAVAQAFAPDEVGEEADWVHIAEALGALLAGFGVLSLGVSAKDKAECP